MAEETCTPYRRIAVTATVKAVNQQEREILHLVSTPAQDRAGDVVEPGGADVSNYLKNPVVLVDHDYRTEKIIGKATTVEIREDGVWARTKFRDTPLGKESFSIASEGLGGWSIGFRPIEYEAMKDDKGRTRGFRFGKWEMLEYSLVAIPMNQEVVQGAIQRGLVSAEHANLFFKTVDEPAKPSTDAGQAPNVTPVQIDIHSAMTAIGGALRTLERNDAAVAIGKVKL